MSAALRPVRTACGPIEAAAHGRAVGLEGPCDEHKRGLCPARPDNDAAGTGTPGASALARVASAASGRRQPNDAEGGPGPRQASRTAGEHEARGSHPASHVLFASGNAWSTGTRDPGSWRATRTLSTTQRYMHVSPAAVEDAIRLLDGPVAWRPGRQMGDGASSRAECPDFLRKMVEAAGVEPDFIGVLTT